MDDVTFSTSSALRFGWQTLKRNLGVSLGIGAAGTVVLFLLNGLSQATERYAGLAMGFAGLSQLVQIALSFVWIRFALAVHDGRPVGVRELLFDPRSVVNYLAVSILYGLMVTVGLVLLIVPGIYLAVRYGFAGFFAADDQADVLEAFRRSSDLTEGHRGRLLVFGLALLVLNLLGALALGIGLLFTVPTSAFAAALVYRRLAVPIESPRFVGAPYPAPGVP